MFRVNNINTRTTKCRRSGVFIVKFEHILYFFVVLLLLNLMLNFTHCAWVVILFFNTDLSKSTFSTYYFLKLDFRLSVFILFSAWFE